MARFGWQKRLESLLLDNALDAHDTTPQQVLRRLGVHTASIALLNEGTIGTLCISNGSNDATTLFQACSISKPVTALVIFKMVELGLLALTGTIGEYLPTDVVASLETDGTQGMASKITIGHLLSHTAGLEAGGTMGFPGYAPSSSPSSLPSVRQVLSGQGNTLPIRLKTWPGWTFSYSGGGTLVLQLVIEGLLQKPFADAVAGLIFQPLGLERSCFRYPGDDEINDQISSNSEETRIFARAYYNGFAPCEDSHRNNPEAAAAGLWSTPSELVKIAQAIQQSCHGHSDSFLARESATKMLTPVKEGMSYGWFVDDHGFRHAGSNVPGWRCNLIGFNSSSTPSEPSHSALSIMTNSQEGVLVYDKLIAAICYLEDLPSPPSTIIDASLVIPLADKAATYSENFLLEDWKGIWTCQGDSQSNFELGLQHDRLWIQVTDQIPTLLYTAAHPACPLPVDTLVVQDLVPGQGLEIMVRLLESAPETGIRTQLVELWVGQTLQKSLYTRMLVAL